MPHGPVNVKVRMLMCENDVNSSWIKKEWEKSIKKLTKLNTNASKIFLRRDTWNDVSQTASISRFIKLMTLINIKRRYETTKRILYNHKICVTYMVRTQLYIFSHIIVHWVYNYMFRPCVLAIVSLYCKLNKQLYNMCVGNCVGRNEISSYSSGWHGFGPLLTGP